VRNGTLGWLRSGGAARLSVCGSLISGPVDVTFTTGSLVLGSGAEDGTPNCGPNVIIGSVRLSNNAGAIGLWDNIINGPVFLSNNTGHGDADQPGSGPEVEANTIFGPLWCSGNTPAPTDDHQPNSVQGQATGQCAGLAG